MANTVRILITAKDEISGPLDKIRDKASLLSKTDIGKGMLQGAGIAAFGMIKSAAFGALDAVQNFAAGSVQAAKEEEVGIARLGASLKANIKDWDGNTAAIEKTIKAKSQLGFMDDDIRDSMARLVAATGDVNKAFAIQNTAMDLARFKGISLADASDALIKVEAGQYRALKSLGIVLREGATQTEALAAVQKVAGGQAAAYMETLAGKSELVAVRLDSLQEEIGNKLTPALVKGTEVLLGFMDALDPDAPIEVTDRLKSMGDVVNALNPMMWGYNLTMGDLADREAAAAKEADKAAKSMDTLAKKSGLLRAGRADEAAADMASSLHDVGKEGRDASKGIDDARKSAKEASDKFDDLTESVNDAVDAFISAAFDSEQLGLELKITTQETKDLEKELKGITDGKGRPLKGHTWKEVNNLKLQISESKEETRKLEYRLDTLDGTKLTDVTKATRGLKGQLDLAGDEAAFLHGQLDQVSRITFGRYRGKDLGRERAAGGDIPPYGESLVGELGPEIIRMGAVGGTVSPSVGGGSGGGGGGLTINVSTPVMTPGSAQALAQYLAPSITRWQQARGL